MRVLEAESGAISLDISLDQDAIRTRAGSKCGEIMRLAKSKENGEVTM